VDPLEDDCCDPEKVHIFQTPRGALEQCNKHTQIVFIHCLLFLISLFGPGGLLLLVSPPVCSPSFSFMGGVGKKT
jgi:hypothetical protein